MDMVSRRSVMVAGGISMVAAAPTIARGDDALVARYRAAWAARDLDAIIACVDPAIAFLGPNVSAAGRDAYRDSTARFLSLVESVVVRAHYAGTGGAMLAYDFVCRAPVGTVPTAELVTIAGARIVRSEIFFDTRPFARLAGTRP